MTGHERPPAQALLHMLGGVGLLVDGQPPAALPALSALLHDLSFVRAGQAAVESAPLVLAVRMRDRSTPVPEGAVKTVEWEGLSVYRLGEDTYVTDGTSLLHLRSREGRGEAHLVRAFLRQPLLRRQRFWGYGLVTLLRARGLYALHAAGVTSPCGRTILLIGPSRCGKSTLTLGLVRRGWSYLSDDAVLLRRAGDEIQAIAFRRAFLIRDEHGPRHVDVRSEYPRQFVAAAPPALLVFPEIVDSPRSATRRILPSEAMGRLLVEGGPELYDRATMAPHLALLASLLRQAPACALRAGRDPYDNLALLLTTLEATHGGRHGAHRP